MAYCPCGPACRRDGASDTARPARFRRAVCAGKERGLRQPRGTRLPAAGASHALPSPLQPPSTRVWARTGAEGRWPQYSSAQEPGATRHTGTQVSGAGAQTVGHQARPLRLGPWVGWRETGGVFAGLGEEPPCRPLARPGARGLRRAQRAAAVLFTAHGPLAFLWPPCLLRMPLLVRLAVGASPPSGLLARP